MPGAIRSIFSSRSSAEPILQRFRPSGFRSAGAVGTFAGNQFRVSPTAARTEAVGDVASGFGARAGAFRNLRGGLRDQFQSLSNRRANLRQRGLRTRLNNIRTEGRRVVGNVREELARRRLGGTSFQTSAVASTEAEFARLQDVAIAEEELRQAQDLQAESAQFLAEIDVNRALIAEEFDSAIAGFSTVLEQLNLDTALAAGLSQVASQLTASNLAAQAEARVAHEAGQAEFLTTIVGSVLPTDLGDRLFG